MLFAMVCTAESKGDSEVGKVKVIEIKAFNHLYVASDAPFVLLTFIPYLTVLGDVLFVPM